MKRLLIPLSLCTLLILSCQQQEGLPPQSGETTPPEKITDEPTNEAADTEFIGLALEDAEAFAEERNLGYRTIEIDGEGQMVTTDFNPKRLNFSIAEGKVIKVTRG
ncbi:MAG: hypothetical protein AAGA96_10470 [Verrucomicrobiota bacterium]